MSSPFELPSPPSAPRLLRLPGVGGDVGGGQEPSTVEATKRSASPRRAVILTLLTIALAGLVSALVIRHRIADAPLVRVVRVVRGHVAQSIPAVTAGRIAPASELTLRSEAAARIASVLIEPGDRVAAGDALFVLDATELERAVRAAESGYEVARASAIEAALRARLARNAAKRTRALVSSGSLARIEDENRAYEADALAQAAAAARARVAGQRAELEGAERARDRGIVKAPIAGLVTAVTVVAGESIAAGAPLVSLADVSRLHVDAHVDESDASHIELGMPVELRFEGDEGPTLRSAITRVDPRVSDTAQGTRLLGFEVSLPENRKWRLGTSVDVDVITDERESALLVPTSAVVSSGKERQVYVFVDGHALPRRVELGLGEFGHVELVRGVRAGESVVDNPEAVGLSGPSDVRLEVPGAERQ